jgi:hypothetical protein
MAHDRGAFCYHFCNSCGLEFRHIISLKLANSSFLDEYFSPCPGCQNGVLIPPTRVHNWLEIES